MHVWLSCPGRPLQCLCFSCRMWNRMELTARYLACVQVIANVSGNMLPARIGCTGFAEGGALAKIAATWAGGAYANAQTRSIVFGAPPVGDARCLPCLTTVLPS